MERGRGRPMSERLVGIILDSFWQILLPGLAVTIPLTAVSFFFAMIIAVIIAIVQFARIPVLRHIARFYIWVARGTPLLVQLFVVFYGLPDLGIILEPIPAAIIVFPSTRGTTARRQCGLP